MVVEGPFADDRTSVLPPSNCRVCGTWREGSGGWAVGSVGLLRARCCHLRTGFQQCKSFVEMGTVRCCFCCLLIQIYVSLAWFFNKQDFDDCAETRPCYPPLIQFRRPLLHRADPCYHLCGDETGTASSRVAISCGTLDDMKLEQKLSLFTGTRTFCTRISPSFLSSRAYRDPTVPTTQYNGLCHVTTTFMKYATRLNKTRKMHCSKSIRISRSVILVTTFAKK